jgi:hypothetical protein
MHRLDALDVTAASPPQFVLPPFVDVRAAGILVGIGAPGGQGGLNADREEVGNRGDVKFVCGAEMVGSPPF